MYSVIITYHNVKHKDKLLNRFAKSKRYRYFGAYNGGGLPTDIYELYFEPGKVVAREMVFDLMKSKLYDNLLVEKSGSQNDPKWRVTIKN